MNHLLTLALCTLLAVLTPASETVREPESKIAFPILIDALGTEDLQHELIGTGIKTKTIFKLNVYAVGLYVEARPAAVALSAWEGKSARRLSKKPDFYKELARNPFGKTLRIVMARDVDTDDWLDDLEDQVRPRIKYFSERRELTGGGQALKRLRSLFGVKTLRAGDELIFCTYPSGRMVVSLRGKLAGEISSEALRLGFFDAFLGGGPISDSAKKTLVRRAPMVIARELSASQE